MDRLTTILTGPSANAYFSQQPLEFDGSVELEAVLRYIVLKHHHGDISTLQLIKPHAQVVRGADGNPFISQTNDCDLFIGTAARQDEALPTIFAEGWVALDSKPYPVNQYLGTAEETKVYVNNELKKSIIFVRKITLRWVRLLCSTLFRVFPWFYPTNPEGEELQIYKSFGAVHRSSSKVDFDLIASIINDACQGIDFANLATIKLLTDYNKTYIKNRIKNLEGNEESLISDVREYEERIDGCLQTLDKIRQELYCWKSAPESKANEIVNFFQSRRHLRINEVTASGSGAIDFGIVETLEYYDENIIDNVLENASYFEDFPFAQKVCDYIFRRHKGVFVVESKFTLKGLSALTPVRCERHCINDPEAMPHPHLCYYGCLGGNKAYIDNYLMSGDWQSAIDQAVAATKNINFSDTTVMGRFIEDIEDFAFSRKCILLDDGRRMTPDEFVNYIERSQDEENE